MQICVRISACNFASKYHTHGHICYLGKLSTFESYFLEVEELRLVIRIIFNKSSSSSIHPSNFTIAHTHHACIQYAHNNTHVNKNSTKKIYIIPMSKQFIHDGNTNGKLKLSHFSRLTSRLEHVSIVYNNSTHINIHTPMDAHKHIQTLPHTQINKI